MAYTLDASALTAYFKKEPGYEKVQELLTQAASGAQRLFLSTVNWGEVYYVITRHHGPVQASQIAHLLETFPIEIIDVTLEIARQAAIFKVSHKMSCAGCFAAALAKTRKSTLVTGDKEFKSLENEIKISWL